MPRFRPQALLLLVAGVSLIGFVISGLQDELHDDVNSEHGSIGNTRNPRPALQMPATSTAPRTDTHRVDSPVPDRPPSDGNSEGDSAPQLISLKARTLSVALENQPLRWVLDEISRQSGMMFDTAPEISEHRVTDAFQNLPIERGLRRLLGSWDVFFFFGGDETEPRYAWVYPKGKGTGFRPIPPEQWASTRELEEAFNDSDPQVREQALRSLAERKGKSALDLLISALDDANDRVRNGALNAAADSNLEIPPETLIRLAGSDPSPAVRLSALAAISNYVDEPSANLDIMAIAINASTDTDPEVRTLAKNLIDRLAAKPMPPQLTSPRSMHAEQTPHHPAGGRR